MFGSKLRTHRKYAAWNFNILVVAACGAVSAEIANGLQLKNIYLCKVKNI